MIALIRHTTVALGLLVISLSSTLLADDSGGSGYSRYGLGDLRYFVDSRAAGMGGAGLASLPVDEISELNPASWADITHTRFFLGTLYEGFSTSDISSSSYRSHMVFNGASVALPVSTESGFVVSAGLLPYSRVNYNVIVPITESDLSFTTQYVGSGGLSLAYIGSSATIGHDLHIGAKLDYYFGTLEYTTRQNFITADYASSEIVRSNELRGIGFSFGAILGGLEKLLQLPSTSSLTIGGVLTTTSYLTETDERFYTYNSSTLQTGDTIAAPDFKTKLPYAAGGGITFSTERFQVAADMYHQHWGVTLDPSGATLRDDKRYSIGAELTPKRGPNLPFTQRWAYRLGFFYDESYYELFGTPINETGLTGGFGIPVFGDSRLNIGIQYSFRGTTDNQLQKDKILRISLTLSGGELWFVRTEQE
ncbi:MAG TPA: hypothetical protein VLY03_02065 [Bacteroidota bacterium]|nr:hypothetical protein [Bacteroidota bacterium]